MKYWFKNVADNIYIYPKSAPRNLILQIRTSDCNSAYTFLCINLQFKLYLTDQYFFVKVIKQSIFHEGVVRVIQIRDLSTDSVMTCRHQASQPGKY